jgi:predicted TIM-barrel fold metal-dependent hydrolase
MNLHHIPVLDNHGHPFPPQQGEVAWGHFRDAAGEALRAPTSDDNDTTLLVRLLVKRMATVFGTSTDRDEVWAARNAAAADPVSYHRLLWNDANIAAMLIDPGFPVTLIEAEDFATVMPCPVYEGYRIERFAAGPSWEIPFDYGAYPSFADFVEAFNARLDAEAAKTDFRFYKSIVAYRTGLKLTLPNEAAALAAWNERPGYREPGEKILRDFLFHQTALKALEHDVAFQVHTGHTSHDQPWANANPIEMTLFLNQPQMDQVRFVLVHGGYPFNTEAGYITSIYPHVFLDLSLMIPWSSIGVARRIEETLEFAPTSKIMYGSDGIMVPELFWISAHIARKALGKVLDRIIDEEIVDAGEAEEIARDILHRTAERVYNVRLAAPASQPADANARQAVTAVEH